MKKIIVIIFILLSFKCFSQQRKTYGSPKSDLGLGLTAGGCAFTAAGFLTLPNYTWAQSNNPNYSYSQTRQSVPFLQQGPRATCIISGITITFTGLITMLAKR